ncbi:MAG: hypothetical protein N2482_02185 [Patescibacteria group bacterium]|nr:hypothetical protein [Patescibacteria group bacterium]
MRLKIDYYLTRIFKKHFILLFSFIFIWLIFIFIIYFFFNNYGQTKREISSLKEEIQGLKKKAELINYKKQIEKEGINISQMNKILNQLVPLEEDYFSIIYALEKISQKTNFIIISYSININRSHSEKLSLTITGLGDRESFFRFLQNYSFGGGRLITIDNINYTTEGFSQIQISLNFYSNLLKKKSTPMILEKLTKEELETLKKIQEKTEIELKSSNSDLEEIEYPTKTNPF